jgi:hypothetical protein
MFNINEFKSKINEFSGPALNSLFIAEFGSANIPGNVTTRDLRFFCQTVNVPGVNFELMQYKPLGVGFPEFMPMSSTPDALNCVFMLDSNQQIITFFHRWVNSIINVGGSNGVNASGLNPREINYKTDYTTTMSIKHFSTYDNSKFYQYDFEGVYPTQLGSLTLSWADSAVSNLAVNFSYERIIHSGFQNSSAETSRFIQGIQQSIPRGGSIPQNIINNLTSFFIA